MLEFLKNVKKGDQLEFDIEYKHPDYVKRFPYWMMNRDAFAGTEEIKSRTRSEINMNSNVYYQQTKDNKAGTAYLPWPNGMDDYKEYESYRDRAIYSNYVEETIESWQGKLYSKPIRYYYRIADKEVDPKDDFLEDITFDGESSDSLTKKITEEVEIVNKVGTLVDFPSMVDVNGNPVSLSVKEMEDENIKARISTYKAESITNWGDQIIDHKRIPVFFVVREEVQNYDSFEAEAAIIYRVLYLETYKDDNRLKKRYKQAIIKPLDRRQKRTGKHKSEVIDIVTPMKNGEYLNYIPFWIFTDRGEEYRQYKNSIIAPLVDVNLGHYRNSADWEHELYQVGLKTIYFPGWDKKKYGNPRMGGALAGPPNTEPKLLEATSDSGIEKEMQNKENRMAVFGSQRISQQGRYVQSAETSNNNTKSETASLSSIAITTSQIMSEVLTLTAEWSLKKYEISVEINKDFNDAVIKGDEAVQWMNWYLGGGGSFDAYFDMMQKKETYPEGWTKEQELEAIMENPLFSNSNPVIDGMMRELQELRNRLDGNTEENDESMTDESVEITTEESEGVIEN